MNQRIYEWVSIFVGYPSIAYLYNLYQNKKKYNIINEQKNTCRKR